MISPADTKSGPPNGTSGLSEGADAFGPVLKRIDPKRLSGFALSVRRARSPDIDKKATCEAQLPIHGAYNLVYRLDFSDGVSWAMRIPVGNKDGDYEGPHTRFIDSEVATMQYLRQCTTVPIPEIISWDPTDESVGVPYILMEWVSGIPVSKLWFKKNGNTPLEDRRLRILYGIAEYMSQLSVFSFRTVGSLSASASHRHFACSPFNVHNEQADLDAMSNDNEPDSGFVRLGPFNSSQKYLKSLLSMQTAPDLEDDPTCEVEFAAHRLLTIMIECLPSSMEPGDSRETFVLAHPDLGYQNILVKEDGTITAFIDWDNVHTVPRPLGYARYPSWLTRDWDPEKYAFGLQEYSDNFENSPEELEYYRGFYANTMRELRPQALADFTTKSHLYEAVWIAAVSPISKMRIVKKIFQYVFPPNEKDSLEYGNTLFEIAYKMLEPGSEERIYEEFRRAFSVSKPRAIWD